MANEYAVNRSDLVTVANAIRERSGTNNNLSFPSGFVSVIQGITGGVELNFEVVGGTSSPNSPKANTIWVNTSTTISKWAFSSEQPSSPSEGMVWIKVGEGSEYAFNALKENSIQLCPLAVYQYASGSWVERSTKIYQGSKWVDLLMTIIIFDNGDQGSSGGFYKIGSGSLNVSDTIVVNSPNQSGETYFFTNNTVNLTPFSKITFIFKVQYFWDSGELNAFMGVSKDRNGLEKSVGLREGVDGENEQETKILDVSTLSGDYYIGGVCISEANYTNKLTTYSIILE